MANGLGFSADQYYSALKNLLPKGPAWELDDSTFFMKMLYVTAQELSRLDADIVQLINESDPRTASKTLAEWFTQWGIPDDCIKAYDSATLTDYHNVLILKIATQGFTFGELVNYIGTLLGFSSVSIGTTAVHTVDSDVEAPLYSSDWLYWFKIITTDSTNVRYLTVEDGVDMALAEWGNELFECLVKALAPCTNGIIFQYGNDE